MPFEIIHYDAENSAFDAAIPELLRTVYVDAGFTAPAAVQKGFAIAEIKQRGKIFLALGGPKNIIGMIVVGSYENPYRQVATRDEAEMQLLATAPVARGCGVGEALCHAFESAALADGFQKAVLSTQPAMVAAHRLYARLGYTRNSMRDWQRADRPFWVYEKNLS
ncbi:MAG: GNAT family N-acetyltransferase [Spirochaetes bacterium]|nr:GNAT family N-acetyltransferase [Spirochaetota bacterium]